MLMLLEARSLAVEEAIYEHEIEEEEKDLSWMNCIGGIGVNSYNF